MAGQGEALAKQFERMNDDIVALVSSLSDEQWRKVCTAEGWTVGVTAHHAAGSYAPIAGMVQTIATRGPAPSITPQLLNQLNAQHAQEFAGVTREQTVDALRQGGAQAAAILRGLSDEQLQQKAELFGNTISAEQLAQNTLMGHAQEHVSSIKAALAAG
jgi:hypothetical protein